MLTTAPPVEGELYPCQRRKANSSATPPQQGDDEALPEPNVPDKVPPVANSGITDDTDEMPPPDDVKNQPSIPDIGRVPDNVSPNKHAP